MKSVVSELIMLNFPKHLELISKETFSILSFMEKRKSTFASPVKMVIKIESINCSL
jgi:hypothetical protein